MLNSTVRGRKAWWGLFGVCLSLLSAPAFSAANPAANVSTVFAFDLHTVISGVVEGTGSNVGVLFGTTADTSLTGGGTVYRVSKNGGAPEIIYQLKETDGYSPQGTLLVGIGSAGPDGYLYGSTYFSPRIGTNTGYGSGTIFRVAQDGSGYTTLHTFETSVAVNATTGNATNTDGVHPAKALIQDATYLYGVTSTGGVNGSGVVFRVRKSDGTTTVLYSFLATDTTGVTSTGDGAYPSSQLTLGSDGRLYGVTSGGGANLRTSSTGTVGTGTIYALNIDGTGFATLYSFSALDDTATTSPSVNGDGVQPTGALLEVSPGVFVGTASSGGNPASNPTPPTTTSIGYGTVFSFTAATGLLTTLYNFDSTTGASPTGNLILNDDGLVYGVTTTGSSTSSPVTQFGNFYSINPVTGDFKLEHPLTFAEGSGFTGSMIKASDGDLYTTVQAGNGCTAINGSGYGAVLRYSLTSGGSSAGYVNCTPASSGGGGSMSPGFMWLLAVLGLVPPVRRRLFGFN